MRAPNPGPPHGPGRRAAWPALAALALAVAHGRAAGAPPAAPALEPPRFTREQMESALADGARWRFVYGTLDPAAVPALRARALLVAARLFGGDSSQVTADRDADARTLAAGHLLLLGGPRENAWTAALAPALPVRFEAAGFRWQGKLYDRPGDALHLVWPNPLAPRRFLVLLAANSPDAFGRHAGFLLGGEDWRIVRDGELARSGTFAQDAAHPWRYDPARDRDLEAERAGYAAALARAVGGGLGVLAPRALAAEAAAVHARGAALLAALDRDGLAAPAGAPAVTLTLYPSLEKKGELVRDTRPEQLGPGLEAQAARPFGREALDLWSVAALRLEQLGGRPQSRFLAPAGAWLADRFEGEALARAVARLYFGGALPTAADAATRSLQWRSPLVWTPARALLARAVWESAPAAGRRAALLALVRGDPPGSLDSLCRAARVAPARADARYRLLADSLARAGRRALALPGARPRPWRPADGFQRGVCLAHSVGLEHGYLSDDAVHELRDLRAMGADWVSLSPFGYLPSPDSPELWPGAEGGPDEETDEAVCEAAAHARALGLRVWITPQLWTRGWVGDLTLTPAGWNEFFDRYHEFLLHWALLAERERADGLVVGHELSSATAAHPEKWRELIADVRRVYTGTLTYGANWDEVAHVPFWDALDLIGVSFYAPLADKPTRDPAALAAGAAKALAALRPLAQRYGRPVLLAELGYAPDPDAPVRPWEEGRGPPDLETQRACYTAVVDALDPCDWVAGALWWKWFTAAGAGGPGDPSYTPRGKPAQAVMAKALHDWQGRPVRVPAAPGR